MTGQDILVTEECLYSKKYMRDKMTRLEIIIDNMLPTLPGSVLKLTGKPVAKNPFDTSITERCGIMRADCDEARELSCKLKLYSILETLINLAPKIDKQFIYYKYEKVYSTRKVKDMMQLDHIQYNTIRIRVLRRLWHSLKHFDNIELALL